MNNTKSLLLSPHNYLTCAKTAHPMLPYYATLSCFFPIFRTHHYNCCCEYVLTVETDYCFSCCRCCCRLTASIRACLMLLVPRSVSSSSLLVPPCTSSAASSPARTQSSTTQRQTSMTAAQSGNGSKESPSRTAAQSGSGSKESPVGLLQRQATVIQSESAASTSSLQGYDAPERGAPTRGLPNLGWLASYC